MALHVRISQPGREDAYAYELNEPFVRQRVVGPWLRAELIVLGGQEWTPGSCRVEIRDYRTLSGDAPSSWAPVRIYGRDVTDRFLAEPIGSARPEVATPTTEAEPATTPPASADPRAVMVVHGRDLSARDAMFTFLRTLDLRPLEWGELISGTGSGAPYVGEVVAGAFDVAQAAVVLFTPDDEARLSPSLWGPNEEPEHRDFRGQARPNVFFEAGMAFGRFPTRTILTQLGSGREASDMLGRHVVRLGNNPQCRQDLAQRLEDAGCAVSRTGQEWLSAGDFEPMPAQEAESEERAADAPAHAVVERRRLGVEASSREEAAELIRQRLPGWDVRTVRKAEQSEIAGRPTTPSTYLVEIEGERPGE